MIFDYQTTIVSSETVVIPVYVVCILPKEITAIKETINIGGNVSTAINIAGVVDETT